MKLRLLKSAFSEAVFQVTKAVSQKTTIPILMGIKITADAQGILLTGSSSDITIQIRVPKQIDGKDHVFVEEEGSVVLIGKVFGEIIRKLPGEEIEWIVTEDFLTTIRSEQAKFQLNGLDPEEYPAMPTLSADTVFQIEREKMKSLMKKTGFAVAYNETKSILTGVLLQLQEGNLTLAATDGHRLSKQTVKLDIPIDIHIPNVVIPGKSIAELQKAITEDGDSLQIIVSDKYLLVKSEGFEFYSRLLNGIYPDTNRLIPQSGNTNVVINTKELLRSVDRAALISRDDEDNMIKWIVQDNSVCITSAVRGVGSVNEKVEAKTEGPSLTISFNPRYMIDALRSIEEEHVEILFIGTMNPFIITPVHNENSLHLIVPIRTQ